ncbi:MAG: PAS domain-containing protein [Immundisolibacteraceae bacterium]|nr:PAS domain-containing protein [Immundisolibacteraceae bacterium]
MQADWFEIIDGRLGTTTAITMLEQRRPSWLRMALDPQHQDHYPAIISDLVQPIGHRQSGGSEVSTLLEHSDTSLYVRGLDGLLQVTLGNETHRPQVPKPIRAGQSVFDYYPPDALQAMLAGDAKMISSGQPIQTEESITDATGKRYFRSTKSPIFDEQNQLIGSSGLVHETTGYRQNLDQLTTSQARVAHSMVSSSLAVIISRLGDRKIISVNDSFEFQFGYDQRTIVDRTLAQIGIVDFDAQERLAQQVISDGEITNRRISLNTSNQSSRAVELTAFVMDVENEPCMISLLVDQSRAQTAEARLQLIADASFEGIALHDGQILSEINQTGCEIFGRNREELIGVNIWQLFPLDSHATVADVVNTNIQTPYQVSVVRPDQTTRTLMVRGHEVDEIDQTYRITVFQDVTDEQELKNQLRRSQKIEILSQLTGGIFHDFNNILASILGFNDLKIDQLSKDKPIDQDKLLHWARQIKSSGSRGRDLVKQMLSFSRGGSARPVPTDLTAAINEVATMLHVSIPQIIVNDSSVSELARVLIDPTQLNQVLLNLCINASHAIDEANGIISITVGHQQFSVQPCSSCQKPLQGDFVVIRVTDNGSGIEPELVEKIFDPFFSTKAGNQGTGMGLSMIHGIIHDCHGHIIVESTPGQNTTFSVLLPAYTESPTESSDTVGQVTENKMVVLIDDDELMADMLYRALKQRGYLLKRFPSTADALVGFNSFGDQWDLLITDQKMAKPNGVDAIEQIFQRRKNLPIIVQTENSDLVLDQPHWISMAKPVEQKRLLSTIDELLNVD